MPQPDTLKQTLKEALSEVLLEQRELFQDIFAEALEDLALAEAIREGLQSERVEEAEIMEILAGPS
jgi:hypothetical protein